MATPRPSTGPPHPTGSLGAVIASDALAPMVAAFVDDVTVALTDAASRVRPPRTGDFRADVVNEAFNLCVAFIDVDDRHTDNELWALTSTFGPTTGLSPKILSFPIERGPFFTGSPSGREIVSFFFGASFAGVSVRTSLAESECTFCSWVS